MKNAKFRNEFESFLKFKNYSNNTIRTYLSELDSFYVYFETIEYRRISKKDIIEYIVENSTSISKQNQMISFVKIFYREIIKQPLKLENIERPRKEKHLPRIIEKKTILDKLSKIENLKHKSILSLGFSTGMRVSEVTNLKIEDIDSKRMLIKIVNGKGRKDRFVPLSKYILNLLREYFKQYKPKEYLFNGQQSPKYSTSSCEQIYKKYIDKDSSFHCLRHSSFTSLLENGTDIRIIQKLAGHNNIKTTEIYTHVSNELLKDVPTPL